MARFITNFAAIALVSLLAAPLLWAQQDRLQQLENKIREQRQTLDELERSLQQQERAQVRQIHAMADELTAASAADDVVTAGYDKGFFVRTPDGDMQLKMYGWIRHHMCFAEANTDNNSGARRDFNTYIPSNHRLGFHFYYQKDWHAQLEFGLESKTSGALDASVKYAYVEYIAIPSCKIRVGAFKPLISQQPSPADYLACYPSPFLGWLDIYDVGAVIYGDGLPFVQSEWLANHVGYMIGMFDGEGEMKLNADDFMWMAWAQFFPLTKKEKNVFVHAAFFIENADFEEDRSRLTLAALQGHEVFEGPLSSQDLDDTNGRRLGAAGNLHYWKDNWRFEAQYLWIRAERRGMPTGVRNRSPLELWGFSAGLSYFFAMPEIGEKAGLEPLGKISFTAVEDRHGDGSGDGSEPLGTPGDIKGQDIWEFVLGAKIHLNAHIRFDFNWVMYHLKETSYRLTNNARGDGDGLLHAFICQWVARW